MKIKEKMTDALLAVYEPVVVRLEKMKAARMWRDGVRQCEKMYRELMRKEQPELDFGVSA